MRVVSLVPSATESLLAMGVTPVSVTRFCEQPGLATVGGTKDPDLAAIVALAPDLVVMDEEENRAEDAAALRAAGVRLHVTAVRAIADVAATLDALAEAVGVVPTSPRLHPLPGGFPRKDRRRRRAFVPIWRRPWMTVNADTYGSSVLDTIGVDNVFADADDRYPEVTLDEARARRPDLVVAPSEPYPFGGRHVPELAAVAPVALVDGRDLFWWGVRTRDAAARLGAVLGGG